MSRMSEITNWAKDNPVPTQFIIPEDVPTLSLLIDGNSVEVSCIEHKPLDEIVHYVNRESKRSGWFVAVNKPQGFELVEVTGETIQLGDVWNNKVVIGICPPSEVGYLITLNFYGGNVYYAKQDEKFLVLRRLK